MKNNKTLYLIAGFLLAGCIVAVYFLNFFEKSFDSDFVHQTLMAVFQSGMVASVMMVTIELMFRKSQDEATNQLIKKINEKLFFAVYKRHIPSGIVEEIESVIFKSDVFRREHELCYTIDPVDHQLDEEKDNIYHVKCISTSSYKLENLSDKQIEYSIEAFLELPVDKNWHSDCKFEKLKINGVPISLSNKVKTTSEQKVLTHNVKLEPKATISVSMEAQLIKRSTDMEVWTSKIPSDGMRLEILTPQGGLEVFAKANHRLELQDGNNNGNTKKEWKLNGHILPYQSLLFWWVSNDNVVH